MFSRVAVPFLLYAALLAEVTVRSVDETAWLPSFILLVAVGVARMPAGIVWSAMAGLMCDGITDRPLGVTMLAATLMTTVYREVARDGADSAAWLFFKAFVFVAVIESSARVVTETVSAKPDIAEAIMSSVQSAATTAAVAVVIAVIRRFASRTSRPRGSAMTGRLDVGRLR